MEQQSKLHGIGNCKILNAQKIIFLLFFILFPLTGYAYQLTLVGDIWVNNSSTHYSIVIEANRTSNGAITGRYAYSSTLRKEGRNAPSSWLYIRPDGNSTTNYIITDCDGNLQEYWSYVNIYSENGITYLYAQMTNVKRRSFSMTAHTASVNTKTWAGNYAFYADGGRQGIPITGNLTLSSAGGNSYSGTIIMAANEGDYGKLTGKVSATVTNGVMTLTLKSYTTRSGEQGCMFTIGKRLPQGGTVAKITRSGISHKISPVGAMDYYLFGNDLPVIVKVR